MTHQTDGDHTRNGSFFLHNPQEVVYNRVKDLFEGSNKSDASSENGLIGNFVFYVVFIYFPIIRIKFL